VPKKPEVSFALGRVVGVPFRIAVSARRAMIQR
jgi:hypothetical protein